MSRPPAIPRVSRCRFTKWILIGCGCICAITLIVFLIGYLDREGIIMFRRNSTTAYFYPADLKAMNLPQWQPTNAIPLSPDQAVLAAMRHLNTKYTNVTAWEVEHIELQKEVDAIWAYTISLTSQSPGSHRYEIIRVLMDGSIWHPTMKKRTK